MIDFLNENEARDYPFVDNDNPTGLANQLVVDCGFIVGPSAGFVPGVHTIWLSAVDRDSGATAFTFRSDAPFLADLLILTVNDADGEFATAYADVTSVEDGQKWEGFVTVGRPAKALAPTAHLTLTSTDRVVEPALTHSLSGRVVTSIRCANVRRLLTTPPEGCGGGTSTAFDDETAHSIGGAFTGDVKLKPGYNCRIDVRTRDNSITIGGLVGGGEGQSCEDPKLYDGDDFFDGSVFRSGGPACNELIKTINGVPGPVVELVAGSGFQISLDDANTVRIVDTTRR